MRAATLLLSLGIGALAAAVPLSGAARAQMKLAEGGIGALSADTSTNLGAFDQSMVGRMVYTRDGRPVGQVKALDQGRLIVAIDSALGIGSRDVGLTRAQVSQSGSGLQPRLVTDLSRDELAQLPEVGKETQRRGGLPREGTGSTSPTQRR